MDEFMQEAQIMKTLRHDNLVQLLGMYNLFHFVIQLCILADCL